jgi:hypothetical protein
MRSALWADQYRQLHVGDFNGDGFDDILLQSRFTTGHATYILLANGQGGFNPRKFITNSNGMSYSRWGADKNNLLVGDYNADGVDDLVLIAKSPSGKSYLLLADGTGAFLPPLDITKGTEYTSMNGGKWAQNNHIALVADFNGDGYDEIFLQGKTASDVGAVVYFAKNIAGMASVQANSTYSGYSAANINDGDANTSLGGSHSWANTGYCPSAQPWLELSWSGLQEINGLNMVTTKSYPISEYDIEYWDGYTGSWVVIESTVGNTEPKRFHSFPSLVTNKIRVVSKGGPSHQDGYCRINEIEVFGAPVTASCFNKWKANKVYAGLPGTSKVEYLGYNYVGKTWWSKNDKPNNSANKWIKKGACNIGIQLPISTPSCYNKAWSSTKAYSGWPGTSKVHYLGRNYVNKTWWSKNDKPNNSANKWVDKGVCQ